ncbi:MAG: protein involved in biosynthesis of mitomycin antibiotics/polyketide fumonisin [Candidatus Poribacteria bacterium]|nr:MAG: protein involved in biosynthesis of mitomycin antibiotics/polyketide fumonisin [Candidatus Poribacteria bacterium]
MGPFRVANALLEHPERLRAQAEEDGYLFFEGLLDPLRIAGLRTAFAEILERHGWLDPGTDRLELRSSRPAIVEGMEAYWPVLADFQRLEEFHALAHDPALVDLFEKLFGGAVLVHPRNIGRIMFPSTPPTPPHQDYVHIQGTPNTWTAWIPLMDIPPELGGLEVLPGSHRWGLLSVRRMPGAGGVGVSRSVDESQWVGGPFAAGDVLIFHSWTVHRGRPNRTSDRLRLSVDYRYQPVGEPVTADSLRPHFNRFDWEFVYRDWKSETLKYYWQRLPLQIVSYDPGLVRFAAEPGGQQEGERR